MNTPEFLAWAIGYDCPIRGFQDGSDPERTERQLRAARAVSDARREGRVFEGLCVQPPDGFRIEEAQAIYGGLAAVEQTCGACPANVIPRLDPQALAGCFGLVPLPANESEMHATVERAIDQAGLAREVLRLFPATQPRWYGLWMQSPLGIEQAVIVERLLAEVELNDSGCARSLKEFKLGLQTARAAGFRLHVALYPRGVVEGTWWRLVSHCPACRAQWSSGGARNATEGVPYSAGQRGRCAACGYIGHPAPEKKRHARGRRPYFPLDRLLGAEQAAAFLVRYAEFQARPESPGREQSPHRPAPPDNLPAG